MSEDFVVRCRGLPWSCTEDDLRCFFSGLSESIREICFTLNSEGRATGEAYVQLGCENDYQIALAKDKEKIGKRYIEIFSSKRSEMDYSSRHNKQTTKSRSLCGASDCIVRLRGLPYGCWEEDISHFFTGLEIAQNGVLLVANREGKQTGEGFVQFTNVAAFEEALKKNKENMGHRYVEVFASSYEDLEMTVYKAGFDGSKSRGGRMGMEGGRGGGGGRFAGGDDNYDHYDRFGGGGRRGMGGGYSGGYAPPERFSPYQMYQNNGSISGFRRGGYGMTGPPMAGGNGAYGGPSRGGYDGAFGSIGSGRVVGGGVGLGGAARPLKHFVFMRGLPFKAGQEDIVQFFQPLRVSGVQFTFDAMGRPSGEARVEFFTHSDATDAMKRDKKVIGDRYVELYLQSETSDDDAGYSAPPLVGPGVGIKNAQSSGPSPWGPPGATPLMYNDFSNMGGNF